MLDIEPPIYLIDESVMFDAGLLKMEVVLNDKYGDIYR
jgi:hypothetical protein